jgi:YbgC/YbaW family acyl-CoA thioester hydrolase
MAYEFRVQRLVEFAETDAAGIMHFANYFRIMESVEHAFIRSLGQSVHEQDGHTMAGWPRVEVSCRYFAPVRFQDTVEVHLLVERKTDKAITYRFNFRKINKDGSTANAPITARGIVTAVYATNHTPDGRMRAAAMPEAFMSLIEVAPPEVLSREES